MDYFNGKNKKQPVSFNLKVMHIINYVAIVVFLLGIGYKIFKWLFLNK